MRFVAIHRGGSQDGTRVKWVAGGLNIGFIFHYEDDSPDAFIRFPKSGHTSTVLRDEKVAKEVEVMNYLRLHTSMPIPRVIHSGSTKDSPHELGPFIIMEVARGENLSSFLRISEDDFILKPDIKNEDLEYYFRQICMFLLELSLLRFPAIGSISNDLNTNAWSVTGRALTFNMNALATGVQKYPIDGFPAAPATSTWEYLHQLADENLTHLWTQRNLARNPEQARRQYIARHRFKQLIPKYCVPDDGPRPFNLVCDDFRPTNILVDPVTRQITAVLDFEYTNSMPRQFSDGVPWLLLRRPEAFFNRGEKQQFMNLYTPRLEQFLRVLGQVEEERGLDGELSLSTRIRASWTSGRIWFNLGIMSSIDVDNFYWAVLDERHGSLGEEWFDPKTRAEMESFVQTKMAQLKEYCAECAALGIDPE